MLKLMKYEFMRKIKNIGIGLVILAILEGVALYTIYKGGSSLAFTLVITLLMIAGVYIFLLIDSITMYSSDLYKKPGYMLFLTPNSSAKIIGSKLLVSLVEGIVCLFLLFSSIYYNYQLIYDKYLDNPQAQELLDLLQGFVGHANLQDVLSGILIFVLAWFSLITVIYLAITIRKTVLSNVKAGGLFSFIIFLVIQWIVSYGYTLLTGNKNITEVGDNVTISLINTSNYSIIYYCVVIVIVYITSSVILSKGVDL